jgi:hypothetical protein
MKIWREQILMDIEGGRSLVLNTMYGPFGWRKQSAILHYLWDSFGYMVSPTYPNMGAIHMHGEWIDEDDSP